MEKLLAFLKDAGTFFYASCDGDKPRVRPFGFFMELNGKFYVGMGQQKESYKQTIANPNVELCAMNKKMQEYADSMAGDIADMLAETYENRPVA